MKTKHLITIGVIVILILMIESYVGAYGVTVAPGPDSTITFSVKGANTNIQIQNHGPETTSGRGFETTF